MSATSTLHITHAMGLIRRAGVIPVVDLEDPQVIRPLLTALSKAGVPLLEVTLRTTCALDALKLVRDTDDDAMVGAGTVLTVDDAQRALDAGAKFIVSPATSVELIEFCLQQKVLVIPGACTPTEVELARSAGAPAVKLFPAEAAGGASFVRALAAPFGNVDFIPTGGINSSNLADYLRIPQVAACAGSWLIDNAQLNALDFAGIERDVSFARQTVERARSND